MSFTVTKMAPELLVPAEPTPNCVLPLSFLDRSPCLRYHVELIFVYDRGVGPADVIRKAASKVLVPYYPVAGRIVANSNTGEPEVVCSGEGAVFVEAYADCSLGDVKFLDGLPLAMHKDELLPKESNEDGVIFLVQVTQFKCGGFTVGIKTMHAIFDGVGASQFMKAIGELAKGHQQPTVKPIWSRDAIPNRQANPNPNHNQLSLPPGALPSLPAFQFQHYIIDISPDYVSQLKNEFAAATGRKCTEFDVLAAKVWQCRTRAINFDKDVQVHLSFPVNVRAELRHLLPPPEGGYYGNCIQPRYLKAQSEHVAEAALLFEVVDAITVPKEDATAKFWRWMKGDPREERPAAADTYTVLNVSDWRRVGIFDVDYGWGKPRSIVPTNDEKHIGSCFLLNSPAPKKGVRIMTNCIVKEHYEAFDREMKKMAPLM
uniref:Acyltransferase n=1 Tax=Iris hollandica TaxID=35876 RepID=Q1JUJ3_IRIHO|nr:acyltransferase [Iris x hollandica]